MRWPANSEFTWIHHSGLEGELDELRALGVVRQLADSEALEEVVQARLHARDAQGHLVGDLLVGGRRGERAAVAVGAAEGDEHGALGRGDRLGDGGGGGGAGGPRGPPGGGAGGAPGGAEAGPGAARSAGGAGGRAGGWPRGAPGCRRAAPSRRAAARR